jgi:DNA-binding NtrC family response regulator
MSRRVLVVDDDRSMVRTLSDVLRHKGFEVTAAYSGLEAVDASSAAQFDIVLMDVKMPGMDGVTAYKVMKSQRPDVRVVLMTAYAAQEMLAEAEREGVLRVMPKPVDIASLLTVLAENSSRQRPLLLVDSDATFLKSLAEVLRLKGFDIAQASTLDEATRLLTERKPAAVLLHMHVGAIGVAEAVAAVRKVRPDAALIVYSGQQGAQVEVQSAVPPESVHAFLQKPFAVEQLTGVLDGIGAGS